MTVLGVNAFHPDAAACALVGGRLVAAIEEERFRRVKHWAGFPEQAIHWCLGEAGGGWTEVEAVAVGRQPRAYLFRKALLALSHPRSLGRAAGRARNLAAVATLEGQISATFGLGKPVRVIPVEHHVAHLASAFLCSPFDEASCLSVDAFGDFVSTMAGIGRGNRIEILDRTYFPHSLGLFYTTMTQFLGFLKFGDEYKVMGLAAYGEPRFLGELRQVVPAASDGAFRLDLRYFRHLSEGVDMTWESGVPTLGTIFTPALEHLLGPARRFDEDLTQRHKDLAASMQGVYEERFFALVRTLVGRTKLRRLALAGGCALNSLANGKLYTETDVEEIYIQPNAGDAGTSLGAALFAEHCILGRPRGFVMEHACWGPKSSEAEIRGALAHGIPGSSGGDGRHGEFEIRSFGDESELCRVTAQAIARGEVVGWYQGRAEWGPRALGSRSILADPRRSDMKEILNLKIKRREPFRPFAPSILEEATGDWFTLSHPDPFMTKVYPIRPEKRAAIPAITHADGTGRLQTVSTHANPRYHALISAFAAETGVPVVLNTSFNENEPIVNRPEEALDCFLRTKMDRLVFESVQVRRI
jgi:carbamoyltransferase